MREEPTHEHWEKAAFVVSLDLLEPFLPGLGLGGLDATGLRRATQELILDEPAGKTPWQETWLRRVGDSIGSEGAERLDRWVRFAFAPAPSDHQEWVAWDTVFTLVETSEAGFRKLALPHDAIPPLLAIYQACIATESLAVLEDAVRGADLSLWDLQACATFGLLPDEEQDRLWSWVRNTWDNHRFQVFFGEVIARLDEADLDKLYQRGRALRDAEGIDVERLVDPRSLRPALAWTEPSR